MINLSNSRKTNYFCVLQTLCFLTINGVVGIVSAEVLSAGYNHTCAIKSGGTVICWGSNAYGKATSPSGQFKSVSAGGDHTCGVQIDDTVACWGNNSYGQTTPPNDQFQSVSAGTSNHSCGIKTDGTVACWGHNTHGETTPPSGQFQSVDTGSYNTCGIKADNTLACWGSESFPPIGSFQSVNVGYNQSRLCGVKADSTVTCWGNNPATPPSGQFKSVSVGLTHICGIKIDDTVACVGDNSQGQATPPNGQFKHITTNRNHTCGIKTDDTVVCWGGDSQGEASPPEGLIIDLKTDDNGNALACVPALYSTATKNLSFEEIVMELYNPLTDEPTGKFALYSGDEMSFKALSGFYNFRYQGGNPIYANQKITESENCYPTYSPQQGTIYFPKVEVPLISILPNDVTLDGPIACYQIMLTQSITQPINFVLTETEELTCN